MDPASIKKISYIANTIILCMVFLLMWFFSLCKVPFLVWFSIPTVAVYLIGFYLIHKDMLYQYVSMVYIWLTLYMGVTTVCLGYGYGFHLYCFSMIPITFVTEYMAYRLKRKTMRARLVSICIAIFYVLCTGYVAIFGAIYKVDQKYAALFWIVNAVTVFCFLIYYTSYLIRSIISSEEQLRELAHFDRLTRLYNRHYMVSCLEALPDTETGRMLAMADIDNFKSINDTYGHNAGDAVLQAVSEIMKQECAGCEIARWGGEEFLILSQAEASDGKEMLERMRQKIASTPVQTEGQEISITVTVGMANREAGQSMDAWIQRADERLYHGKHNGKNQIVG